MVLEERITVSSEEVAKDIVRYLKKENISARILTQPRMTVALILAGHYADLHSFLSECQERHQGTNYDSGSEDSPPDYNPAAWKTALLTLNAERDSVARIMQEHTPGDVIAASVYQVVFLKTDPDIPLSPELFGQELATVRTLISNKLCEITQEGFVLIKLSDPDKVLLYVPYEFPFPPEQDVCDRFQITCIRHFRGEIEYVVHIGPDILFLEDIEAFVMFLSSLGIVDRSLLTITERCMTRLRISQEVISQLFEAGEASREDLRILFVDEIATQDGQGHVQDRFGLSPAFVDELIADLRRLNMIKGKDSRLRPGNPAGLHQRNKGSTNR